MDNNLLSATNFTANMATPVLSPLPTRRSIESKGSKNQCVAVLTSGGDSQGMNAAVRAAVRMTLFARARAYAVYWGYQGLVEGKIEEMSWDSVSGMIHKGGTIIGSARSQDFMTHEGRRKAAFHLVKRGISKLVIIGGDGSLTGANSFREEWSDLLNELLLAGELSSAEVTNNPHLNIVGIVGSIDNDFCGTDMTIGADSALHRIIESADAITTTAASHQRAFVLEVMGRNCGYLALMASISCSADWVCIPEWPMESGWQNALCRNLKKARDAGRLTTIVIVAEGAQDTDGVNISSNEIKDLLSKQLGFDTRVTVLGHVQRGGIPSAFDRLLASRFGAEAALCVLEAKGDSEAYVMCLNGCQIVKKPLNECIALCNSVKKAYEEKDTEKVLELRGRVFRSNMQMYMDMKHHTAPENVKRSPYTFCLINCGSPAGGINAANASFVKGVLYGGHDVIGVQDGFAGLVDNKVKRLQWTDVEFWASCGGSKLGMSRNTADTNLGTISRRFREHNVTALLIIGGFEAFQSLLQLYEARDKYSEFCIPMLVIPATMSNNVPGCWLSLGADTTLNCIVESCDRLRQSASSSTNGLFIVETMGGKCGYLATMAGIAAGGDSAYITEEPFTLADLKANIDHLKRKFQNVVYSRKGLVLRAEHCNENYSTEFMKQIYDEEGKGLFTTNKCVLGHVQQGGPPSPFDRISGARSGLRAYQYLNAKIEAYKNSSGDVYVTSADSACVLGLVKNHTKFTPINELKFRADFENRIPKDCWWLNIRPLLSILAHYHIPSSSYHREDDLSRKKY